jgi:hypothetical protein
MSHQICHLEQAFSIQPLIDLDDKGNIFVQQLPKIRQYKTVIYEQMARRALTDAVIHLCPWGNQPEESSDSLLSYASYMAIWQSNQPVDNQDTGGKIQRIHYAPLHPQANERFLVITSPTYARALISWQPSERETFGVLMTTSAAVRQISETLIRQITSADL